MRQMLLIAASLFLSNYVFAIQGNVLRKDSTRKSSEKTYSNQVDVELLEQKIAQKKQELQQLINQYCCLKGIDPSNISDNSNLGEAQNICSTRLTSTGIQLMYVKAEGCSFMMGSDGLNADTDEMPVHRVSFSKDYWLGKYEVTKSEYIEIMSGNPKSRSNPIGTGLPVVMVSWHDAVLFCKKLTALEQSEGKLPQGYEYRLPTEAEWEYAAKGGACSKGYQYAGGDSISEVAWCKANAGRKTHSVGQKQANELGLHDMSGNVWEWCLDWYGEYTAESKVDPKGASSVSFRVRRGGSWYSVPTYCRSAIRRFNSPRYKFKNLGFRICLGKSSSL